MSKSTLERHGPENFWLAHVRLGVATSSVVVAVVALYLFTTPDLPGRDVLWIVLSFGAAITVAAALTPWRRILAVHSPERYLLAWSATVVIVIVVLASEDGGSTSPMTALLVLPLVFTAAAYPVRSVVGVGALTVAGRLAIAFAAPPVHLGQTAMQVAILLVLTVMSALISRNQRRALARTQDLAARLERLASVDSLTGCFNHRGFHERLEAEAARAIREDLPLALLHLDLDHFKAVNDTFGHPVGDEVLVTVGATLTGVARRSDTVGRLGGEEFAIVLPQAAANEAEQIAERVRQAVRDQHGAVPVTVSIGVATLEGADGRLDHLVKAADTALYAAKHNGRDRVTSATY